MPDNNYNYGKDYIMSSDKIKADRPDAPLTRMKPDFTPDIKDISLISYPTEQWI